MIDVAHWNEVAPADWRWAPEFTPQEMACKCCNRLKIEPTFMDRLLAIRKDVGVPMQVSSGFRCPKHNEEESHTGATGPHTTGHATDLRVSGETAYRAIDAAIIHGMTGIGLSQKGDHKDRFIHVDDLQQADGQPRPWVWTY